MTNPGFSRSGEIDPSRSATVSTTEPPAPFVLSPRLERWLGEIDPSVPLAIVLGGSCNGLSFVRSLGRRRIPTLLLDTERTPEMHTRFGASAKLPSPYRDPEGCLAFLEQIGERLRKPGAMFATSDAHVHLLANSGERLCQSFRYLVPEALTVARIIDKRAQYEFASSIGVPIPATSFPESIEHAARIAAGTRYPCLLKPYDSHAVQAELSGQKVLLVESALELMAAYCRLTGLGVPLMIQEYVPGEDSALVGYLGFWDEGRQEKAWLTKRKLRQNPPRFGDGALTITADLQEVASSSRRLLDAYGYRGFVGVEFKLDARDGTYRLMEVNPRTVSCNEVAIRSGVDFPWIGYNALIRPDSTTGPVIRGRSGVTHMHELWDTRAFLALRRSGKLSLLGWLWSLRRVRSTALGAWDDPAPLLAAIWRPIGLLMRQRRNKPLRDATASLRSRAALARESRARRARSR